MTPIEFADKYLAPPERYRFIENIGKVDYCPDNVLIDYITDHAYKLRYFMDDFFYWEKSLQGDEYWRNIKARIARIGYDSGM